MIVLIRGVQDLEKRDERVKRAYAERHLSVLLRERAGANPSSGRLQRHVQTLQLKAYTQTILHRAQQKYIWQFTCNVFIHLNMYASILNSVLAVHTTYITVLLYGRYYSLKNAMAPRVFSSFWDNSHADQYDAAYGLSTDRLTLQNRLRISESILSLVFNQMCDDAEFALETPYSTCFQCLTHIHHSNLP